MGENAFLLQRHITHTSFSNLDKKDGEIKDLVGHPAVSDTLSSGSGSARGTPPASPKGGADHFICL